MTSGTDRKDAISSGGCNWLSWKQHFATGWLPGRQQTTNIVPVTRIESFLDIDGGQNAMDKVIGARPILASRVSFRQTNCSQRWSSPKCPNWLLHLIPFHCEKCSRDSCSGLGTADLTYVLFVASLTRVNGWPLSDRFFCMRNACLDRHLTIKTAERGAAMRLTAFGDEITLWWHWFLCRRQFEWACQEDTADGRERRNAEFL